MHWARAYNYLQTTHILIEPFTTVTSSEQRRRVVQRVSQSWYILCTSEVVSLALDSKRPLNFLSFKIFCHLWFSFYINRYRVIKQNRLCHMFWHVRVYFFKRMRTTRIIRVHENNTIGDNNEKSESFPLYCLLVNHSALWSHNEMTFPFTLTVTISVTIFTF